MGATVDKLVIKFETDGDGKVKASIAGLNGPLKDQDEQVKKNTHSLGLFTKALAAVGTTAALAYIVRTASAYEQLNARLITATGSQEKANTTFAALRDLAFEMPGRVSELTDSYIKLVNLGLDPTREALISYGNTAAAQGKSLNQLIEAVADASTGEFERLKEFGIKSRVEGDKVRFIFRGMETQVANSSRAIQDYLIGLGNNEFAGAMEAQNKTLAASFNELLDTIDLIVVKFTQNDGLLASFTHNAAVGLRTLTGTETIKDVETSIQGMRDKVAEFQKQIEDAKALTGKDKSLLDYLIGPSEDAIVTSAKGQISYLNSLIDKQTEKLAQLKKEQGSLEGSGGGGKKGPSFNFDAYTASVEAELQKQYAALEKSQQREEQRIAQSYQNRLLIIQNAEASGLVSEQRAAELSKQIEEDKQRAMTEIAQRESQKRQQMILGGAQTIAGAFSTYTSAMLSVAESNYQQLDALADAAEANGAANAGALRAQADAAKKEAERAFEENKKAQRLNVIVNTASAIMRAFSDLGPIGGSIFTPILLAAGSAQLRAIDSAHYGGVTSPPAPIYSPGNPSGTGGGGYGSSSLPTQRSNTFVLQVENEEAMVSLGWVKNTLVPLINEAGADGVTVTGAAA